MNQPTAASATPAPGSGRRSESRPSSEPRVGMTERWRELEQVTGQVAAGAAPAGADILRFGRLYQAALSDLGYVQKHDETGHTVSHLNRLLGKAYLTIYRRSQVQLMDFVWFFLHRFPALVWRRIHFTAVAALIFVFSSLIGFLCITNESKLVNLVVPESMQERAKDDLARGRIGREDPANLRLTISSEIMFNNIRVSFLAFALGIVFGLGTVYVLITNGLLLGGLASLYHSGGYPAHFWSLILPHGGIELSCCFITAGAGLMIGYSIFRQTPYRRGALMAREALDAVRLVAGTIPWFVVAGLIESYITPSSLPISAKFLVSAVFMAGFLAYLGFGAVAGRMVKIVPPSARPPGGPVVRPPVRAGTASSSSGRRSAGTS